jgi:hypothetical protein
MRRIFESWWWNTIGLALIVFWGGCFPSNPKEQPWMFVATHVALAVGFVMCVLSLASWAIGSRRRRAH